MIDEETRVVDQNVDLSERIRDTTPQARRRCRIRKIRRAKNVPFAVELRPGLLRRVVVHVVVQRQPHAAPRERAGDRATDTSRGARYQGCLALVNGTQGLSRLAIRDRHFILKLSSGVAAPSSPVVSPRRSCRRAAGADRRPCRRVVYPGPIN